MRLLHTSDWHVGRAVYGRPRAAEHHAVLTNIVATARDREVDLIVVAGDQFDGPNPNPTSERLVIDALCDLADVAPVVVIAGNHDSPKRLNAIRQLWGRTGVHALGTYRPADDGGLIRLTVGGDDVAVAALPWVSQRRGIDIDEAAKAKTSAADYGLGYAEMMGGAIAGLCEDMDSSTLNVFVAHLSMMGASLGGGERDAHCTINYHVPASKFPPVLDYVALGHFHRPQVPQGSGPAIHYSGSPMPLDFAEDHTHSVKVVDMVAGLPPKIEEVPVTGYRPMLTRQGPAEAIETMAAETPKDAWVRLRIDGEVPPGTRDVAAEAFGDRLVLVEAPDRVTRRSGRTSDGPARLGRPLPELFGEYLDEEGITHQGIRDGFETIHEEVMDATG